MYVRDTERERERKEDEVNVVAVWVDVKFGKSKLCKMFIL